MKKHKTKSKLKFNKPRLVATVLIAFGLALFVSEITHVTNFVKNPAANTPMTGTATPAAGPSEDEKQKEAQANADAKQSLIDKEKSSSTTDSGTVAPFSSDKSITLSGQEETDGTVTVFTKLYGYSDGTCKLITLNQSKTNIQSAPVIYQRESSSCAGFSVPISPLGTGTWNLELTVTSNGTTDSKTITFEVK